MISAIRYYLGSTYRRKELDKLFNANLSIYRGIVLDIGGRDRGDFSKPKSRVEKWIFADIVESHNPDMILDVTQMTQIKDETIDVVLAAELFEHVKGVCKGLKECHRVLKTGGHMVLSAPFIFPVHADPYDYQRYTLYKWKSLFDENGFDINYEVVMGGFFSLWAQMYKSFVRSLYKPFKWLLYLTYPLADAFCLLDKSSYFSQSRFLKGYESGYFFILEKK